MYTKEPCGDEGPARVITEESVAAYAAYLRQRELAPGTVACYTRSLRAFAAWNGNCIVTHQRAVEWKASLSLDHAPATVNTALAGLNRFFTFQRWEDCRVKPLRLQRRVFRDARQELSRTEYIALVATARSQGQNRLALLLETICATGIRVSETRYITMEAVRRGRAEIALKGKIRVILLPGPLCRKLLNYARAGGIASGPIFRTRTGRPLSRIQIWYEMKSLCHAAGVAPVKVFPHNLRHLFARSFYAVCRDVVKVADVLGHSSIETTRVYLRTSGTEHLRQMERMRLIN